MTTLYIVANHIGNPKDVTFRAIEVLKEAECVIFEEYKEGLRLLKAFDIDKKDKTITVLNEHNEQRECEGLAEEIFNFEKVALISDSGTPLLADPGFLFLRECQKRNIRIVPVPGVSSILALLMVSGINLKRFYYYGFLSQKKEMRKHELIKLKKHAEPVVILETPYRLLPLLKDIADTFGDKSKLLIGYNLTMKDEIILKDTPEKIYNFFKDLGKKGEFVLVIFRE